MGLKYKLTAEERATLARNGIVKLASGEVVSQVAIDRDDEAERLNTEARQRRQAAEAAERAERQRQEEEQLDAALAPTKERRRHEWLAAHPDQTPEAFEKMWKAHLRPLAVAELHEERTQQSAAALLRSGQYVI